MGVEYARLITGRAPRRRGLRTGQRIPRAAAMPWWSPSTALMRRRFDGLVAVGFHTGGQPALVAYGDSLGTWLSEAPDGPAR